MYTKAILICLARECSGKERSQREVRANRSANATKPRLSSIGARPCARAHASRSLRSSHPTPYPQNHRRRPLSRLSTAMERYLRVAVAVPPSPIRVPSHTDPHPRRNGHLRRPHIGADPREFLRRFLATRRRSQSLLGHVSRRHPTLRVGRARVDLLSALPFVGSVHGLLSCVQF